MKELKTILNSVLIDLYAYAEDTPELADVADRLVAAINLIEEDDEEEFDWAARRQVVEEAAERAMRLHDKWMAEREGDGALQYSLRIYKDPTSAFAEMDEEGVSIRTQIKALTLLMRNPDKAVATKMMSSNAVCKFMHTNQDYIDALADGIHAEVVEILANIQKEIWG